MSRCAETKVFEIPELRLYILQFLPPTPRRVQVGACAECAGGCALGCLLACFPFKRPLVPAAVLH